MQLLELDNRRRGNLSRYGRPEHTRYVVEEDPDGTIHLRPAKVMTEDEWAFWQSEAGQRVGAEMAKPQSERTLVRYTREQLRERRDRLAADLDG